MKDILLEKIYGRGAVYLIISAVIVVAFILLVLYPYYRSLGRLDMEIVRTKRSIDTRKVFLPLYYKLVEKSKSGVSDKLPLPDRKKLSKGDINSIPSVLKGIAIKSGTEILFVNPDVTTLMAEPGFVSVNTTAKGDFFNFRNFLIEIGKLPYLRGIEKIEIQQKGADKELTIKMWLEVD